MSAVPSRAKAIFTQAIQCSDPAAREVLLREQCGTDPVLREQVDILLEAHTQAGSSLERGSSLTGVPSTNRLRNVPASVSAVATRFWCARGSTRTGIRDCHGSACHMNGELNCDFPTICSCRDRIDARHGCGCGECGDQY